MNADLSKQETFDEILKTCKEDLYNAILEHKDDLIPKSITVDDIFATVSYFLGLPHNVGNVDDIDNDSFTAVRMCRSTGSDE